MTKYNEDYLNDLIKKAKKSWEGVDVDSFMSELRDDLADKENAEKEQKPQRILEKQWRNDYE